MATSAFSSATKRATPLPKTSTSGDDGESSSSARMSAQRRHRSLSRFSHRRMPDRDVGITTARKGKFVNTVRGSGSPEISLDDLAVEFFDSLSADSSGISSTEKGRPGSRKFSGRSDGDTTVSQRRGRSVSRAFLGGGGGAVVRRLTADTESSMRRRSVSRQSARGNAGDHGGAGSANSRRRRSLSVVRCRISDSESSSNGGNLKNSVNGNGQITGSHYKPVVSALRPVLRRSFSQNEIKYHDGYSSHSSAITITDDEGKDARSGKHGGERIIRAVYTQNKATTKTRKSLGGSDADHDIASITKDYATKLQESEERKRDLLAEILLEDQRGKELSKIVKGLLTESSSEVSQKPSRARKRSKDRSRISTCLTDEAEKHIEEFISNIEDTDFSSPDDERSETSSSFGIIKTDSGVVPKFARVEMDGIILPWLQWETSTDSPPLPYLSKSIHTPITRSKIWVSGSIQDDTTSVHETSIRSTSSSRGSSSPAKPSDPGITRGKVSSSSGLRKLKIDVSDYLKRKGEAGFLYESWKLRHRTDSGSLVLCSRLLI
ncbi:PREDICTED: uncharacterized protein LOC104825006 isoform X2 [Tarenaya hassleriana]|uniref:uncharacterized protein LOC104825006 isoform X2 n=1 Tax=Tarenaya hassleriana TaxID=28532 RepID=UPI00053C835A|nr:PREDICTED: uncharacterized protein LOC104825006 isoform X2 [Tarenaya hassleriana]